MSEDFTSVPVLDYNLISKDKPSFLRQLRHALIHVGFLYLQHPPVTSSTLSALLDEIPKIFALPQAEKDAIVMRNNPHFLGYTSFGREFTKGKEDQREQFDFATPYECPWKPGHPDYRKLWGPAQWPPERLLPSFRHAVESYLAQVEALSFEFVGLIADALLLPPGALDPYFEQKGKMQHRCKLVKYPPVPEDSSNQGVGPHFDAGFLTFLLQASNHRGLQVQNFAGEWIDVPPLPDTFVVNIGKGLETLTSGVTLATSHRVLSPPQGSTPRYSVPFFQNIAQDTVLGQCVKDLKFPKEILDERDARGGRTTDSVNFSEYGKAPSGHVALIGRIKSHPDVAERHYPELFTQIFPNGLPSNGSAY